MKQLLSLPEGPPAVSAVIQRGKHRSFHSFGRANLASKKPIGLHQRMRIASMTKAFTGAVVMQVVESGKLKLSDTVGEVLPNLPAAWYPVTLRQTLYHTSGIPSYTSTAAFQAYLGSHLRDNITHQQVIDFANTEPIVFPAGSAYEYSNTDNYVMAMMAEKVTGNSYAKLLRSLVLKPLGMRDTSLPNGFRMPRPFVRGYAATGPGTYEDLSEVLSASGVWAAGAIVSSAADVNTFIRAWAGGSLLSSRAARRAQTAFLPPFSGGEPPGPGINRGGLTLYRYKLPCGVVFGHTGNFPGYTQFMAASPDGSRSVHVSANIALAPPPAATGSQEAFQQLRRVFRRASCAALAG